MCILGILELVPEFSCEVLAQERLGAFREDWEARQILRLLKVRSAFDLFFSGSRGCRLCATAKLLLLSNHSLNTIVHILHEINFGASKTSFVRNIVDMVS